MTLFPGSDRYKIHMKSKTYLRDNKTVSRSHSIYQSRMTGDLTFRHRASSIQDRRFTTHQRTLFVCLINEYTSISLSDICLTVHH